jgi:hypothetical protein
VKKSTKTISNLLTALVFCTSANSEVVRVKADGATIEQAKQTAFELAIVQVVGEVIVTERELQGSELTKDFTGSYSSGYITDYEMLDMTQFSDGSVSIDINVDVSESKIAQRMMLKQNNREGTSGVIANDVLESQLKERRDGDRLLLTTLDNYPSGAYLINVENVEYGVTAHRQKYLNVNWNMQISQLWLQSFNEALGLISEDSTECSGLTADIAHSLGHVNKNVSVFANEQCRITPDVTIKQNAGWFGSESAHYVKDLTTLTMVTDHVRTPQGQQRLGMVVHLLDGDGVEIDRGCLVLSNEMFIQYQEPTGAVNWNVRKKYLRPVFDGRRQIKGNVQIDLTNINVSQINQVKLSIEKGCQ